jgi:hypothetical protein
VEFEQRFQAEVKRRLEETILPHYNESYAKYNDYIKWARRKGIMSKNRVPENPLAPRCRALTRCQGNATQ